MMHFRAAYQGTATLARTAGASGGSLSHIARLSLWGIATLSLAASAFGQAYGPYSVAPTPPSTSMQPRASYLNLGPQRLFPNPSSDGTEVPDFLSVLNEPGPPGAAQAGEAPYIPRTLDDFNFGLDPIHNELPTFAPDATLREQFHPHHQSIPFATGTRKWDDVNLQFELPGAPWVEAPLDANQQGLQLILGQVPPRIFLLVIANRVGTGRNINNHDLMTLAQNLIRARAPNAQFSGGSRVSGAGMEGLTFETKAAALGVVVHFSHFVALRNGYAYQIVTYGDVANAEEINERNRRICERIHQIDPTRVADAANYQPAGDYHSSQFGIRIDLENQGWVTIPNLAEIIPVADFGAEQGPIAITVAALPMPNRKPNLEALTTALLGRHDIRYPGVQIVRSQPCRHGGLQGQEIHVRREVNQAAVAYRIRVIADARCAYMISGWAVGENPRDTARIAAALDRVRIDTRDLPQEFAMTETKRNECGVILNELALETFKRGDYLAAIDYLKSALEFRPAEETIVDNYVEILRQLDRPDEAIAYLDQNLRRFPNSLALRAAYARLLAERGDTDRARNIYADVFAKGYTDEGALDHYLVLAKEAEAYDEAITVIGSVAQRKPTVFVQTALASLYRSKGDYEQAILMLKTLHQLHPGNALVTLELAFAYETAEQYDAAIELTQGLIEKGQGEIVVWLLHGRNQMNASRFAEAKRTFESAIELYPHSEDLRDMLKVTSNSLGQGDNSLLKTPIAAVSIPPIISDALHQAALQPGARSEKYGAEELIRLQGVSYRRNQPLRTTLFRRIKVHTSGGVAQYNQLSFEFNPTVERFYVNRLVVLDPQGKIVAEGDVDQYYVIDEHASGMATSQKVINLPVPGLKPGYYVECMVTREERFAADEFPFQETILSASVPVGVSCCYVVGDVAQLKHAASMPVDAGVAGDVLHCTRLNPPPYRTEHKQPSYEKLVPVVWVCDATATWDKEALDYHADIAERLVVDDATRQLAVELTSNCATNREKLASLAAHVQRTCSYKALEFGRRALVPNSADQTVRLKYGDCKDHAVMLRGLLEAVGITSYLALVNTDGVYVPEVPSLDQFDHMVLYVPGESIGIPENPMGGLLVDTTDKSADPLLVPPTGMSEKTVLVLDPQRPRFVRVPSYSADAGQITTVRHVDIRESSAHSSLVETEVREQITLNSPLASGMRYVLHQFEAGERRNTLQQILGSTGEIRLKRFTIDNLETPAAPLVLNLEYAAPNAFHRLASASDATTLVGKVPSTLERSFLEAEYLEERTNPFQIRMPLLAQTSSEICLPQGYRLADVERLTTTGQNRFAAWASRAQQVGTLVRVEHCVRTASGSFAAGEYAGYYGAMKDSLSVLQTPVTFRGPLIEVVGHEAVISR